jgi:hypothetical protein
VVKVATCGVREGIYNVLGSADLWTYKRLIVYLTYMLYSFLPRGPVSRNLRVTLLTVILFTVTVGPSNPLMLNARDKGRPVRKCKLYQSALRGCINLLYTCRGAIPCKDIITYNQLAHRSPATVRGKDRCSVAKVFPESTASIDEPNIPVFSGWL